MKNKLEKFYGSKAANCIFLVLVFLFFFVVCSFIKYSDGDDAFFLEKIKAYPSLFDFTSYLTRTMNGRITATISLWVVFGNSLWVWRFLNAFAMTLYMLILSKIIKCVSDKTSEINNKLISFASFGIMGIGVFGYACLWITGTVNYLWPCTAGLIAIYPLTADVFGNNDVGTGWKIISPVAGVYACLAQEQTGAVIVAFGIIMLIYQAAVNKKLNALHFATIILITVAFLLLIFSPANENRGDKEILRWLPEYAVFTFGQKFFITYQWMMHSVSHGLKYIFVLLWIMLFTNGIKNRKYLSAVICAVLIVSAILPLVGIDAVTDVGLNELDFTKIVTHAPRLSELTSVQLAAMAWWSVATALTFIMVFFSSVKIKTRISEGLLFLAALASMAVMFFSPTIYASGDRVLFAPAVLISIICALCFTRELKIKNFIYLVLVLGITAALQIYENIGIVLEILK